MRIGEIIKNMKDKEEVARAVASLPRARLSKEVSVEGRKLDGYQAIVSEDDEGEVFAIVSDRYNLVQHRDAGRMVLDALDSEGVKYKGEAHVNGGKAFGTIIIDGPQAEAHHKGEVLHVGFRWGNSYDASMSLLGEGFAYRLVCTNGMISQDILGMTFKRHVGDIVGEYVQVIQKVLTNAPLLVEMMEKAMTSNTIKNREGLAWLLGSDLPLRHLKEMWPNRGVIEPMIDSQGLNTWTLYNLGTAFYSHHYEGSEDRSVQLLRNLGVSLAQDQDKVIEKGETYINENLDKVMPLLTA